MRARICIDEVAYPSFGSRYADPLFEVVTRRYGAQKPLLLSTDKAFADWRQVFPHAACVVTLVDRRVHRAEVIDIEAESYRLQQATELSATSSSSAALGSTERPSQMACSLQLLSVEARRRIAPRRVSGACEDRRKGALGVSTRTKDRPWHDEGDV